MTLPWYANIVNYLVTNMLPPGLSKVQRDKIKNDAKYFVWDDPYLWKHCGDQVIRRCVPENEIISILTFVILMLVEVTLELRGQREKC